MGALLMMLLLGVGMLMGPVMAGAAGHGLGAAPTILLTVLGVVVTAGSSVLLVITRLYVKTKASEAFVRTGMGGMRVIKDGGSLALPVVHQVVRISLQTLRLEVSREGGDALITKDKLRADVRAEFFVRVQPDDDSIRAAARSFGEQMGNPHHVRQLVEDKLVSALRTVAATKTLEELNIERDRFMEQVTQIVAPDLAHNGLTLETATISKLDQTDPRMLRDDNIFDAQGKRTIAEITQQQLTERNRLERTGEQLRKQQDVEARKLVIELDRAQTEAETATQAEILKFQAQKNREASEKQMEAQRAVELANVARLQALEVAQRDQQSAVEVAERRKQEAVAQAEMQRANAQAQLAQAEARREAERQNIRTVEVEAEATREKMKALLDAQAQTDRAFMEQSRAADAAAYRVEKEAEARMAAADAEAMAITKKAKAEADAARARADGETALSLIPVEVERQKVLVERQRVEEVLKRELEVREQHGRAAQDFELAQLRINREAEVRIEAARATVNIVGKVQAQVFGTPQDVARMTEAMMAGMGITQTVEGVLAALGPEARTVATQVAAGVAGVARELVRRDEPQAPAPSGNHSAPAPVVSAKGPAAAW